MPAPHFLKNYHLCREVLKIIFMSVDILLYEVWKRYFVLRVDCSGVSFWNFDSSVVSRYHQFIFRKYLHSTTVTGICLGNKIIKQFLISKRLWGRVRQWGRAQIKEEGVVGREEEVSKQRKGRKQSIEDKMAPGLFRERQRVCCYEKWHWGCPQ